MDEDAEILRDFLVESYENLDQLDQELVALEEDPEDRAKIASIFRTIHTIKGTAGVLGFHVLESVTHVGENLLGMLRDGKLKLTAVRTSGLLQMVDAVREILDRIENTQAEGDVRYDALVKLLGELQGPAGEAPAETPAPSPVVGGAPSKLLPVTPPEPVITEAEAIAREAAIQKSIAPPADIVAEHHTEIHLAPLGQLLLEKSLVTKSSLEEASLKQQQGDGRQLGAILVGMGAISEKALEEALASQKTKKKEAQALVDASVRVDVGQLDHLMNLVGELVLARNQIVQYSQTHSDAGFLNTTQRLNLITTELQEGVMKTRMQPIGNIWNKFPRIVRDLAVACKKQVSLEMEGRDTELDRTIIEAIKDPLTHVVRNSVDHGIESPADRRAVGKPEMGKVTMRAFHEGGQVNIEISDDGKGINTARVREKALQKGLISHTRAAQMSERELAMLIFMPGFSTAAAVTNVSGRGVGMDVVKTNIEKIGGTVDVMNKPGEGMTLKLKIPLTLAIIPALIVVSSGERFAIPQVNLLELVRLEGEQAHNAIEYVNGAPLYRLRGDLLPLVSLNDTLALKKTSDPDGAVNIVVLHADGRNFGLIVDMINDTEEIVVKPLGKELKSIPSFAGTTIMGDGKVALILDVIGIAQQSKVLSSGADQNGAHAGDEKAKAGDEYQSVLLCTSTGEDRLGIPLSAVARLEEFARERLEKAGGHDVIQYRGEIMPLVHLAKVFGSRSSSAPDAPLQVVVYSSHGRDVGIVVDRILDIVEASTNMNKSSTRRGVMGSSIINGSVTELLDLVTVIRTVDPSFPGEVKAA